MSAVRQNVRRLGVTVAAVAVTVGVIGLMRLGAQWIAGGGLIVAGVAPQAAVPDRLPAPRVYALETLIPSALRANLGGMELASTKRRLPMPLELAMRQGEEEARAAGWKEMTLPLAYDVVTLETFGKTYVTPDKRIVTRTFAPLAGNETMREDLVMPAEGYLGIRRDMTLEEVSELHGREVAELIPEPLKVVCAVRPLYTQFLSRGGGASFLVVGVSALPETAAAAQVSAAFARTGWTPSRERSGGWEKANLSASVKVMPLGDAGADGATVMFRISDDENLTRKETEEDE